MRKLFFSLFSIIIFSGYAVAQSATENAGNCEQFKAIVVAPPEGVDSKFVVKQPDNQIESKGIVINPCKPRNVPVTKDLRGIVTKVNPQISNPFQLSKPPTIISLQRFPRVELPLSEATKKLIRKPDQEFGKK
jgi:hypothetical protein